MAGEQLPPVVIPVEVDDADFLVALDRDVAALRAAAGEIDGLLAGLDLGAALADSMRGANLGAINIDELTQGLSEGLAGVGNALGQDVGTQLTDAVRSEGIAAGAALAEGVAEGASGAGDSIGQDLTTGLTAEASSAGARAGESLSESLTGAVSGIGQDVASQVDAGISGLPDRFASVGAAAGHAMTAGLEGALLGLAGAAVGAAGALGGVGAAIEARLADVLMQAGQSAGPSLAVGISAGAAGGAASAADTVARALEASMDGPLVQAGGSGGDALMAGIQQGVKDSADQTAVKIGESLQVPLEAQMAQVGQLAGDAFNAGLGEAGGGGGGTRAGGAIVQEFAQSEPEVAQQGEQLGRTARLSFAQGWQTRSGVIPFGGQMEPDELINMGRQQDVFVPDMTGSQNAWTLASKVGAQQAAEAAWQAYGDELSGLVIAPDRFLEMTDAGIAQWKENVAVQAAASGEGFVSAFADAMTMGMAGIDWGALTSTQAAALGAAMRGTLTEGVAVAEPDAAAAGAGLGASMVEALQARVASTGSAVADELIAQVAEARQAAMDQAVALATSMAEQGEKAGGRFATFFSQGVAGLQLPFQRDPEKVAASAAEAGAAAADAMVASIQERLGAVPEIAAADGEQAGSRFGQFFSGAWEALQTPFQRDPERFATAGGAAGVEYANAFAAQLEARLGEIGAAGADGLEGLVAQQLEVQLSLASAQATAEYEQQLTDDLAAAQAAAVAQVVDLQGAGDEIVQVFQSIYERSSLLSDDLVTAMANGLRGIEADTASFTAAELALWDEFTTALTEKGTQAAYEVAAMMNTTMGKDLVGSGLGSTGIPFKQVGSEAEGLAGDLGNVEKAASGAAGAFGGMSAIMYGPAGMALFMLQPLLSALPGLFSSSAASAADFTQVIQQDSGAVGDNTAATIQSTLAKSNLASISKQLGLSQAQLIEYAAGEASVQQAVTDAYDKQVAALDQAAKAQDTYASTTTKNHAGTRAGNTQLLDLEQQKQALDQVTAAVAQAVQQDAANNAALLAAEQTTQIYNAAVNALGQSMLLQTQQTKMSDQATAEFGNQILFAESSVSYMNAAMGAAVATSRESALTNAYASVALLGLGTSQTEVNAQLSASEAAYSEAQQGAQAYNTALTSLNGSFSTLYGDEASFTGALKSLTTSIDQNGTSLDANSVKGFQNAQAAQAVATAAQQAAVAVFQNDMANGHASQAYQDANAKLQQEKDAFEQAAEKAHVNKDAVQQLANELFQLPPSVTVNANVTPALDAAYGAVDRINTMVGTITVTESANGSSMGVTGGAVAHKAAGGPVQAGQVYHVNEQGAEGYFVPPADGFIIPHDEMNAITAGAATAGPSWVGASGAAQGGGGDITVHVYLNGREIAAETRAESQWYKNHNGTTGYT